MPRVAVVVASCFLAACGGTPNRPELVAAVKAEFPLSSIAEAATGKGCFFYRFSLVGDNVDAYLNSSAGMENGWRGAPFLIVENNGNVVEDNRSVPLDCLGERNQWELRIHEGPQNFYFRTGAGGLTGFFVLVDTGDLLVFGRG